MRKPRRASTVTTTTNKPQKQMQRVCAWCGATFTTTSPRARYCSAACKQAAYRARRERKQEQA